MSEERAFLNADGVYVSNTRVVIHGTTYAMANITSVRKHVVPASNGCAALLIAVAAIGIVGALATALTNSGDAWGGVFLCGILLLIGVLWFRSLKTKYHLMLATAGGERQGLSSEDQTVVDRVTAAVADAIVHRG